MSKKINIKRKSILDDLQNDNQQIIQRADTDDNSIVEVPSIQEQVIQQVASKNKTNINVGSLLSNIKNKNTIDNIEVTDEEIVEGIEISDNVSVTMLDSSDVSSADVDTTEIKDKVNDIVDIVEDGSIPDIQTVDDVKDINVEVQGKKRKSFIKLRVTINSKVFPKELSMLASIVKDRSNGVIIHRKCDLRGVSGVNKVQLKNSDLKLYSESYTIKPTGGVVNKSTRIILSSDVDNPNHVIVFMQTSRSNYVHKFDITDEEDFIWLADWIVDFYEIKNFQASKHRILNKTYDEDEMFKVVRKIAKTKQYKLQLPKNVDGKELTRFSFIKLYGDKTHLRVSVVRDRKTIMQPVTLYNIYITSEIDDSLHTQLKNGKGSSQFTMEQLKGDYFIPAVENFIESYDNSKNELLDIAYNKLKHRQVKLALTSLINHENSIDIGLEIVKVLNADDAILEMAKLGKSAKSDYDTENIVIKTKYIDYAIIQYLGIVEVGGSIRGDKKYNARHYKFRVKYSVGGVVQSDVVNKHFEDVITATGILTNKPKK